jgi:NADH:ubiquinone oxidoreductase subunit E
MSLPIAGGGGGRPPVPPTHRPLGLPQLMNVASELEEAFSAEGGGPLNAERMEELAADLGAPLDHVYAAAGMMTMLPFDESDDAQFNVCVGGCQGWGALEVIKRLAALHSQRRDDGKKTFGIIPRRCLDNCERAAVVMIKTPDGMAGIAGATVEGVEDAVTQLCGP